MRDVYSKTLAGLFAALFVGVATATDPVPAGDKGVTPRIVASPAKQIEPEPKPGVPAPCDVGKFIWLDVVGYDGAVSWDFSAKGVVSLYPESPPGAAKDYYPGVLQGESANVWHKAPSKTAVPCMGVADGAVTISAWGVKDNRAKKIAELNVIVGKGPRPPPDIKPDPKPDDPKPDVSKNPFGNTAGLHVMMTFDRKETESQKSIIYGAKMREYLDSKCAIGPDGRTKAYKIWPVETQVGDEFKLWTDAFAKTAGKRRILIGNGAKGYEGDLPANVDETIKLLKQFEE